MSKVTNKVNKLAKKELDKKGEERKAMYERPFAEREKLFGETVGNFIREASADYGVAIQAVIQYTQVGIVPKIGTVDLVPEKPVVPAAPTKGKKNAKEKSEAAEETSSEGK